MGNQIIKGRNNNYSSNKLIHLYLMKNLDNKEK